MDYLALRDAPRSKGFIRWLDHLTTMQLAEPMPMPVREPIRSRLMRWQREVPLYRDLHRGVGNRIGSESMEWNHLPFITRREMKLNFPRNFLRDGVDLEALLDRDEVEIEHTSGTSGERQPLLLGAGWWNQQESRAFHLNHLVFSEINAHPLARRAVLASPSCGNGLCNQGQTTARERTDESVLLLSTGRHPWLWSPKEWDRVVRDILDWEPLFLDVDPVYATGLARHCVRHSIRFPSVGFVLSSYEFISALHRRAITRTFGVPVFNLYGATETGHLLMEDEEGRLRASAETALLEVIEPDADGVGELVVTTMTNEYMPLIRYRIGDLAHVSHSAHGAFWELHGRVRDSLLRAGGKRVTTRQIDDCLAPVEGLLHYQCVQNPSGHVALRYIQADSGIQSDQLATSLQQLQEILGQTSPVPARAAELLLSEPSGKFRLTRRQLI